MERQTRDAVLECAGAIVGAGFASGREIMRFFSLYGKLAWLGVGLAVFVMGAFTLAILRKARHSDGCTIHRMSCRNMGWAGNMGTGSFVLLLGATGGSMLAASGELFQLALPLHGAYWIGLCVTLVCGLYLSVRGLEPLAYIGKLLIPALAVIFLLCLQLPRREAVLAQEYLPLGRRILEVCLNGLSYGALNITLAAGVLCELGVSLNDRQACRTSVYLSFLMLALLGMGNAVLLRQTSLYNAALPMVMLLSAYGKLGFWLGIIGLYLAVFTTFLAAARGLGNMLRERWNKRRAILLTAGLILPFAFIGFGGLVGMVYPALGFLCFGTLMWIIVGKRKKAS